MLFKIWERLELNWIELNWIKLSSIQQEFWLDWIIDSFVFRMEFKWNNFKGRILNELNWNRFEIQLNSKFMWNFSHQNSNQFYRTKWIEITWITNRIKFDRNRFLIEFPWMNKIVSFEFNKHYIVMKKRPRSLQQIPDQKPIQVKFPIRLNSIFSFKLRNGLFTHAIIR